MNSPDWGLTPEDHVGIVGAGAMGSGIAQVAAVAGHDVWLHDANHGEASRGRSRVEASLQRGIERGRMEPEAAAAILERLHTTDDLHELAGCALVIEAVVEDLDVKREVFGLLEGIVTDDALLATNTSSISISAVGAALARPGRLVGMHFFNPAPAMRLVEVVSGVATDEDTARHIFATASAWGKIAVHARSSPGFIVNRVARPYYAEALRLLEERVADAPTIDALLTEGGGFRMGPCALMDLVGHDVNHAVTRSVYDAFYQDPRFRPSLLQQELVDAGWLGVKSGRGFYDYTGTSRPEAARRTAPPGTEPSLTGVEVFRTDGRTAAERARTTGRPTIVHDLLGPGATRLAFAASPDVGSAVADRFVSAVEAYGLAAVELPDVPGLVVMRTVAMLVNEGVDAVHFGVGDEEGIDHAMRNGVNYPLGPIEWGRMIGFGDVLEVIDHLYGALHDPRYRASIRLRELAQSSLSASDSSFRPETPSFT